MMKNATFAAVMNQEENIFNRTTLLVGNEAMKRISEIRVIIFGIGGVGSWVAEGLVRSGVRNLTIVDSDRISITNVNRQSPATTKTIGRIKVEVMKSRLLDINPQAEVEAIEDIYNEETSVRFHLEEFDYVIDAIDSSPARQP